MYAGSVLLPFFTVPVCFGLLALRQGDGRLRRGGRELPGVLPDRHRLPAGDDVLDALLGCILTAERDRLQLVGLQSNDDRVRETVVGRGDTVDLVARLDQHLLEDRSRLLVVPARRELLRALRERSVLVERVEDRLVTALEEERVVVGLAAVQLGDDRLLARTCRAPSGRRRRPCPAGRRPPCRRTRCRSRRCRRSPDGRTRSPSRPSTSRPPRSRSRSPCRARPGSRPSRRSRGTGRPASSASGHRRWRW